MRSITFDPVGNRTQKTSTIPGYPGGLTNYNANDQISTDSYDNDGNTTASNGVGYVYDFENRLVQAGGGISIVYDGDGNRVSKTVAGVTTAFLVDDQNPTGYSQVVYEATPFSTVNREVSHTFVYGLELTLEQRVYLFGGNFFTQTMYFVYDGHGSVRELADPTGTVTDTYDYDAFGNLLHSTGTTYNNYRYSGEQFDPDLNLYFNRARYLNVSTARFWTMDSQDGDDDSPLSLHRYLYVGAEPVDDRDPSGHGVEETLTSVAIQVQLFVSAHPILTAVSTAVLLSLAPAEFTEVLPPNFGEELQFINAVENEAKELTTIRRLFNSSWLDKLKAGTKFESWMLDKILANVEKQAEQLVVKDGSAVLNNARVKGSAVIDAIIRDVITEFKTSFGAVGKYQTQQFARYAGQTGRTLEYVFLHKPSPQQIETLGNWVKAVAPSAKLAVSYILGD